MAYLRYSRDCDWHVFEEVKQGEAENRLAVWHKDHETHAASYTVSMVQRMLESEDYSSIPGYQPQHKRMLRKAFGAWLSEQSNMEI
jgi:hypothetical protein